MSYVTREDREKLICLLYLVRTKVSVIGGHEVTEISRQVEWKNCFHSDGFNRKFKEIKMIY